MEEKILYRIGGGYYDTEAYVRLSKTNIEFLKWLSEKGFLFDGVDYTVVDDLSIIVEF